MAWTLITAIDLGPTYAGLTDLRAQLFDAAGATMGSPISSGFTPDLATGRGQYGWSHSSMPNGFGGTGFVRFYSNAAPAVSSLLRSITRQDEFSGSIPNASTIAAAVRDISNNTPAVNSLGAAINALNTTAGAVKLKTDLLPSLPAAKGDVPTASQNAIALLDLSNGIETGVTPRQALRLLSAVLGGISEAASAGTIKFKAANNSGTVRVTQTTTNGVTSAVRLNL